MASPSLELWGAVVAALKADNAVTAFVADRVFDRVPADAVFPYLSLGSTWEIEDDAECIDAVDVGLRVDVWSRTVTSAEVRRIADAVRRVLHRAEFDLPENALAMIEHQRTDTLRDADGLTLHSILEFSATVEIA